MLPPAPVRRRDREGADPSGDGRGGGGGGSGEGKERFILPPPLLHGPPDAKERRGGHPGCVPGRRRQVGPGHGRHGHPQKAPPGAGPQGEPGHRGSPPLGPHQRAPASGPRGAQRAGGARPGAGIQPDGRPQAQRRLPVPGLHIRPSVPAARHRRRACRGHSPARRPPTTCLHPRTQAASAGGSRHPTSPQHGRHPVSRQEHLQGPGGRPRPSSCRARDHPY